jgi:hypothetical protein
MAKFYVEVKIFGPGNSVSTTSVRVEAESDYVAMKVAENQVKASRPTATNVTAIRVKKD